MGIEVVIENINSRNLSTHCTLAFLVAYWPFFSISLISVLLLVVVGDEFNVHMEWNGMENDFFNCDFIMSCILLFGENFVPPGCVR